jgi:ABC-2 type transport system ATP-binding protein
MQALEASMSVATVEWRGVTRRFGKIVAVADVSLEVRAGEIVALLGRNGAGKSTLLRLAAGMLRADAGAAFIEGEIQEPRNVAARRTLGYVPDTPVLFGHLSAREHLCFLAQVHRLESWEERAARLFETLELGDDADVIVAGLSLGIQQRVSIACALLHDPHALLLDEPLNALDPVARRRVQDDLVRRAREGAGIVVSSHQLEAIEGIATRIVVVDRGRVVLDGSAAELVAPGTTLEALFLRVAAAATEA